MNMKIIFFWNVTPFNDLLPSCSEYHDLPKPPVFTTSHFRTTLKMYVDSLFLRTVGKVDHHSLHDDTLQQLMILKLTAIRTPNLTPRVLELQNIS